MPAGSGPTISTPITSGSITTGANSVTVTSPTMNLNEQLGTLITVYLTWTPSATQTITCKLYQTATTGTQVNPSAGLIATATGTTETGSTFTFVDTSAFALTTQGAVYVAGFTASTGTGTVAYAFIEVETIAPIQ
jgi:hypothetical protein